jgi:hypothetical protein
MATRTQDDDPYASLPDPTRTTGAKPAKAKPRAPRRSQPSAQDDDPYTTMADPTLTSRDAAAAGAAGRPEPTGSPTRRFLQSAYNALVQPVKGANHAVVEGPQNPEEAAVVNDPLAGGPLQGRINLAARRLLIDPQLNEARKAREEFQQSAPLKLFGSTPEEREHRRAALGHAAAALVPGVGPAVAGTVHQIGEQGKRGDIAGAIGTGVGSAIPYLLPEAAGRVAKSEWLTRTIPHGQITRLIRPMAADLKFGKDPAQAILDEGITGNTLEDIGNRVSDRLAVVGKQLDAEARKPVNASKVVDVSQALQPLDTAMAEAVQAGDRQLFAKLREIKTELTQNWRPFRNVRGEITLRATGPRNLRMSPYEAVKFKRMVGDRIVWSSDPLQGTANAALGKVYGRVKDAVNNQVPGLRELNSRYSNLVSAAKSIQRRIPVENRNAAWSLTDVVLGTHSIPLAVARKLAMAPGVRTRAAAGLYNLPRRVPRHPALTAAPAIGATQSAQRQSP